MPKNYRFHDDNGEESCYESEEGTEYHPQKKIGSGAYASARKFQSADSQRSLVVLNPKNRNHVNFKEVDNKYTFFRTIYPKQSIYLIKKEDTYRLVLPYIVGIPYSRLSITNRMQQIELFISAISALKDCHNKGYVVLDLKMDNIHYDKVSGKSYLLDGGISVKENNPLDPSIFFVIDNEDIISKKKKYTQIAPECWSQTPVLAQKSMDVYALGVLMKSILKPFPDINRLIRSCLAPNPEDRPSLHVLEKQLQIRLPQPRSQKKDIAHDQTNYIHALRILATQSIMPAKKQYKRLRKNNGIQKAIIDFNNECTQLYKSHTKTRNIYISIYKRETLSLMLRGATEFKKEYPRIEKKALVFINTQLFKQFIQTQPIKILTTLNGSQTKPATKPAVYQPAGKFLLFQAPKRRTEHNEEKNQVMSKIISKPH